ncbi:MAG TPA: DUF4416 family protein [Rectinemataceae bacterium]|nr:DUF4416 family protein [Rectinemataceae bacterium]
MGTAQHFEPARLLIALLYPAETHDLRPSDPLRKAIEARLGEADVVQAGMAFTWTGYYATELGDGIERAFLSFPRLVDPSRLAELKRWTNSLEAEAAIDGRRSFNLDPGILSLGAVVLATTKNRAHRIALSGGIYGELTLIYHDGAYRPLPWTYADWRSEDYGAVLLELRGRLKRALAEASLRSGAGGG